MQHRRNNSVMTRLAAGFRIALLCLVASATAYTEEVVKGTFELIDHQGQVVTEHSFDGKLRLVFFGFTRCPDVCPTTLFEIARVMRNLGDDAVNVQPIFISVDVENDTPEILARYVAAFHPAMVGLTGSRQQLDAVAASFNVTYGVEPATDSVYHSSYLFLMDRQGRFLDLFGYGVRAATIEAHLREYF